MAITPNMRLYALCRALTQDLDGWRTLESDDAQFKAVTEAATEWKAQGRPESELVDLLERPVGTAKAVRKLARAAVQVAGERDLEPSSTAESSLLVSLVMRADHLLAALDEITTLYLCQGDTLSQRFQDEALIWQM